MTGSYSVAWLPIALDNLKRQLASHEDDASDSVLAEAILVLYIEPCRADLLVLVKEEMSIRCLVVVEMALRPGHRSAGFGGDQPIHFDTARANEYKMSWKEIACIEAQERSSGRHAHS